ncbi:MAG TPA: GNAT family N-acetyltransferase [Mycobacteriales bacterium]|nr:GNAT family N-acetyltransferase [Mycobacteriales bacterium]
MRPDDVEQTVRVQGAAFAALADQTGEPVADLAAHQRELAGLHRHFVAHDEGGAWVATRDSRIVGCAMALRRDDLWGLSLLVVDPTVQSTGIGRRLLDATLRHAAGCERAAIQSSSDPRAIRLYATSGFALFPQMAATGKPVVDAAPASVARVRDGGPADHPFADGIDRAVRGAGRGPDHALIASWADMYVVADAAGRGYAYRRGDEVYLLAATDDATAAALLWHCFLRAAAQDVEMNVFHLTSEQQWAIEACFAARLKVTPGGPVFWRGATPPRAYLPSGAFL